MGRPPIAIVGNAGTTNTGAVDPLGELADIAARSRTWFHVDGAYGAAAVLDPSAQSLLTGLERADSVSLDPRKWWFQPYKCAVLLYRDGIELERTYTARAEYLTAIDRVPTSRTCVTGASSCRAASSA